MKRSWIWALALVLGMAGASYGAFLVLQPEPLPPGFVYGNGHVEGTNVRIAAETGGRVVEHAIIEGQPVKAGQRLIVIDPGTSRDQLVAVQSELASLRNSRSALDAQSVTWTHHVDTARQQVARVQRLVETKLASQQYLDQALDAARQAEGQLNQLRAQRQAMDGQIASAEARVRQAETQIGRTEVVAPEDGTILVRSIEQGEVIQAGQPLALLVDLKRLELKIYLTAAEIGKVRLDQPARVRVDAFAERTFDARVARVDAFAQFTPRDIHLPDERAQTVYGVTLALANPDELLKPGMPADAWVRWDERAVWPARLPVPRD